MFKAENVVFRDIGSFDVSFAAKKRSEGCVVCRETATLVAACGKIFISCCAKEDCKTEAAKIAVQKENKRCFGGGSF